WHVIFKTATDNLVIPFYGHCRAAFLPGFVLSGVVADIRPQLRYELLPVCYLYCRGSLAEYGRKPCLVSAPVLVSSTPLSIYRISSLTWNYIRDHLDQRTQTYLRLQSHGGFDAVHRYTLVCCLGAPYVRYRDEPIPGVDLHAADAYYRCAFGRKNLQLRHYPMAGQYPVY